MSDDSDHDDAVRSTISLLVYGDSPRSIRAAENMKTALVARGIDPRTVETVDVMTEPERALELDTIAAPQLIIGGLRSNRSLYVRSGKTRPLTRRNA